MPADLDSVVQSLARQSVTIAMEVVLEGSSPTTVSFAEQLGDAISKWGEVNVLRALWSAQGQVQTYALIRAAARLGVTPKELWQDAQLEIEAIEAQ